MTRRNRRVTLRWIFAILIMFGVATACDDATTHADDGSPEGVRVQKYGDCLIFTHDTAQGASVTAWCSPGIQLVPR